jgi:hypothetical protein
MLIIITQHKLRDIYLSPEMFTEEHNLKMKPLNTQITLIFI